MLVQAMHFLREMTAEIHRHNLAGDPIQTLIDSQGKYVLAIISGVEGPSYRPMGAMMAISPTGNRTGTLSSGCIESDIAHHAKETLATGAPQLLRYGQGSQFIDIQLPCGGGLEILLLPEPDRKALQRVSEFRQARKPCTLEVNCATGLMSVAETGLTRRKGDVLFVRFEPDIRFLIFGKGPEACTFAGLVQSVGYPNLLLSPDQETLNVGLRHGSDTCLLLRPNFPEKLNVDYRTAIVLFFHDHEWEPSILASALETPAFYIGAQGSRLARDARYRALGAMGVNLEDCKRLHGPVGLVPSARDPGTLSVSVLAEVLSKAMEN